MRKIKDTLTLVKDGVCEYKIRIATPMEPVSNELEVAQAIARLIEAATGVLPEIDEAKPDNWQYHEILVGKTIREDDNLKIDRDGMEQDDCEIVLRNGKIVLAAATDDGLWACAARFAKQFVGYDTETMSEVKKQKALTPSLPYFTETGNGDLPYQTMLEDTVRRTVGVSDGPVCYSSPAVYERLLGAARGMAADQNRKVRLIHNSRLAPCNCPACQKAAEEEGTPYGAYFRAVAKIAETLQPLWKEQRVQIAAYMETLTPPAQLVFPENVDVLVCDPKLVSAKAINDPSCKTNRAFARVLKKWTSVARVQVLDFTSDYYYYPAPLPNYFTVRENVRYYASLGVRGVYLQWNTVQAGLEFGPARKKVYRALLSDPMMSEEDYSALWQTSLARVYGYGHADDMRVYMELMDAAASEDYTVVSRPAQVVPVRVLSREGDRCTYDLSVMSEVYRLWDRIHPYREASARSQVYLSQMLFNRYQSRPESHAFVQFSEWFTDAIGNFDKTDVINTLIDQAKSE